MLSKKAYISLKIDKKQQNEKSNYKNHQARYLFTKNYIIFATILRSGLIRQCPVNVTHYHIKNQRVLI